MKISPPRTVKSPAPGKRIPAPAGVGDRFVDSLAKNLKDEAREKAGKLDMDALPQKDGTPVVDLEVLSGTPLRAPRCRNALKERPMTTIDQSDLSRILLALEQGLEVVGELRTSMNEAFAGCRLSEDDRLELTRVTNAHTDLHRASRIVTDVMAGKKPLHREMHQPFVDEIFMKLGAIDHDIVARGAVEGGR